MSTVNQLGKYQPYPEYKDSGVEWLGYIPCDWEMKKIAWHFVAKKGRNGQMLTKEYCGENLGEFPVYSGQTENDGIMGRIDTYEFDTGDAGFLFSTTVGAKAMTLSLLKGRFSLSQNCMVITPQTDSINVDFAYYHFQPLFSYERSLIPEHMQASFRMEDLYQYKFVLPSIYEQRTIAAFLDYETARIDQLIAKQQQLIELLKEKRQAVISHAVTKGLNPNAPMKDSGVEWLGQVPEHWGMTKVKHLCYVNDGNHGEEYPKENDYTTQELGVPFIRGGNMQRLSIVAEGMLYITKEKNDSMRKGRLEPEDILFMNRGEIGKLAKIPTSYAGANLNSQIAYLRCHKQKVVPDFMLFFLSSTNVQNMISSMKMGSVLTQFPIANIINISVPLPSQNEQQQIMHELSQNLEQFFGLEKKAEAAIYLMQERRTALISAAVTGKIDLRNWKVD